MTEPRKAHWEHVYSSRSATNVGWYTPHLERSLAWIDQLALPPDARIIDVGGGAATLIDDLLDRGYEALTVLDVAEPALDAARARLGERARAVTWLCADVTEIELPADHFTLWHDRAVFHFLTSVDDRRAYVDRLQRSLADGGHVIIGTFAPEAPPKCSGLPVERYTPETLATELGAGLELVAHANEMHVTPGGVEQMYLYCRFRKAASASR